MAKKQKRQKATVERLTPKEQRLLEVLLDPLNRTKNIAEVCSIVPCDRMTYYRAFAKRRFADIYRQRSQELVKQHIGPVINAFIREATRGSFQHGKVLLEMAGLYTEKGKVEVTGKDGGPIEVARREEYHVRIEQILRDPEARGAARELWRQGRTAEG